MAADIDTASMIADLHRLGVQQGDTLVVRAELSAIGRVRRNEVLNALLGAVGETGTIVGLAFTNATFVRRPDPAQAFCETTPSYAGSLPNTMLKYPGAKRSRHPICSFVALGARAEWIVEGHGPHNDSYAPIRKVMQAGGKMVLIGCVRSSPGFTTAHLAEYDLGLYKRLIMPWLSSVYYSDESGQVKLFRVRDAGLCSKSYVKFYSPHVANGDLRSGMVGAAYSVLIPAVAAYKTEREILENNPRFNVCGDPGCFVCNARRWDRLYRLPLYLTQNLPRIIRWLTGRKGAGT